MNLYKDQFNKYVELVQRSYSDYSILVDRVMEVMVGSNEEPKANAVVLFGFSGNGKSTWISKFVEANPDYHIISMDKVFRNLFDKYKIKPTDEEVLESFGEEIEKKCSNGKNVIIDGNFLNLLTRNALADTLKLYGYQVNLVDITDNVLDMMTYRIMDVAGKKLGVKIDSSNSSKYVNDPTFISMMERVIDYYYEERRKSNIDEQKAYNVIGLGVDNVFYRDTPYEEITHIPGKYK